MRYYLIMLFCFSYNSMASQRFEDRFKQLNLDEVIIKDLCTNQSRKLSHFKFNEIKIWSIDCGNCLWQIEDQPNLKQTILINVDRSLQKVAKACRWLKKKNISMASLHDQGHSIKKQIGENFPIPVAIKLKDKKIDQIKLGYWRTSK